MPRKKAVPKRTKKWLQKKIEARKKEPQELLGRSFKKKLAAGPSKL